MSRRLSESGGLDSPMGPEGSTGGARHGARHHRPHAASLRAPRRLTNSVDAAQPGQLATGAFRLLDVAVPMTGDRRAPVGA